MSIVRVTCENCGCGQNVEVKDRFDEPATARDAVRDWWGDRAAEYGPGMANEWGKLCYEYGTEAVTAAIAASAKGPEKWHSFNWVRSKLLAAVPMPMDDGSGQENRSAVVQDEFKKIRETLGMDTRQRPAV